MNSQVAPGSGDRSIPGQVKLLVYLCQACGEHPAAERTLSTCSLCGSPLILLGQWSVADCYGDPLRLDYDAVLHGRHHVPEPVVAPVAPPASDSPMQAEIYRPVPVSSPVIQEGPMADLSPAPALKETSQTSASLAVKVYPGLAIAALKSGRDREFSLWLALRMLNQSGSGILHYDGLVESLCGFGYSRATVYSFLRLGNGKLWRFGTRNGKRRNLYIFGLRTVSGLLGAVPGLPKLIPLSLWSSRPHKQAFLYASFHKTADHVDTHPISRQSLEDATGVNRRTQLRYDITAKFVRIKHTAFDVTGQPLYCQYPGKCKVYFCRRQLPNEYHSPFAKGHRGMASHICNPERSSESPGASCQGLPARRWFLIPRQYILANQKGKASGDSFLLKGFQSMEVWTVCNS